MIQRYLETVNDKPFKWGLHDCLTFTNQIHAIQNGDGYADDWVGEYRTAQTALRWYKRLLDEYGYDCITQAIDDRLERLDCKVPPTGSIVARREHDTKQVMGYALGCSVLNRVAFVTDEGLVFLRIEPEDIFWGV